MAIPRKIKVRNRKWLYSVYHSNPPQNQKCYFVDLFVRVSNSVAINMYKNFGYSIYRQILEYYAGGNAPHSPPDEDAFDMRKALSRDPEGKTLVAKKKVIKTTELFSN